MKANLSGFKRFVEEMDPSMDKKMGSEDGGAPEGGENMDFFGGLGDEMGMEWKDIISAFAKTNGGTGVPPNANAHFFIGKPEHEKAYKTGSWRIVPGSMTPNGADIMLIPQKKQRVYQKGKDGQMMLDKSKQPDTKRYHLNRQQLQDFLFGDWAKAAQQGGAGGAPPGGAPGGAPPM